MNLEELSGKTILLLGKSRALDPDEFEHQLKTHDIACVKTYDERVAFIVEGRMMNPVEQENLDVLYVDKVAPIISIDEVENLLCASIDAGRLMMALKLSGDRQRLLGYLQNPLIDNALFLKLLGLYDWQGEGFFENDENRDVTAALISRFYQNIERNHNVQYANMGLMHLIEQSEDAELIEKIATLQPLQDALKNGTDNSTMKILFAIATHRATPTPIFKQYVRFGSSELKQIIAQREGLDASLQKNLYESGDAGIHEALSLNPSLCRELIENLSEKYMSNIVKNMTLDDELFDKLVNEHTAELTENPTLSYQMQRKLFCYTDDIQAKLAANTCLDENMVQILYETNKPDVIAALSANPATPTGTLAKMIWNKALHSALAANTSTGAETLKALYESGEATVLEALSKNPSTPTEILYQLQVDQRYARYVMENPGFGEHIQRENIGWL